MGKRWGIAVLVVIVFAAAFTAALAWPDADEGSDDGSQPLVASVVSVPGEVAAGDELVVEVRIENRSDQVVDPSCVSKLAGRLMPPGEALDTDEQFWTLECALEGRPLEPGESMTQQLTVTAVEYEGDGEPEALAPGEYDLVLSARDPEDLAVPEPATVTVT